MHLFHATSRTPLNARQRNEPGGLLSVSSGFDDPLPARSDGTGDRCRRFDGDAMPELPREYERGWGRNRVGWFLEPDCQSCHTGTATKTSAKSASPPLSKRRARRGFPLDRTFATSPIRLTRSLAVSFFLLATAACNVPHATAQLTRSFPAFKPTTICKTSLSKATPESIECTACHTTTPTTVNGGPHGMHPVGQTWVNRHPDLVESSGSSPFFRLSWRRLPRDGAFASSGRSCSRCKAGTRRRNANPVSGRTGRLLLLP